MIDAEEKIKEYGYTNFRESEESKEEWSVYLLEDKTLIKLKAIPLKFFKRDNDYAINAAIVVAAFSPGDLKGEPDRTPLPITDADKAAVLKEMDMKLEPLKEPWNKYELDDVKVSIKTVAISISSTSRYDAEGDPVYFVNHQSLVKRYPPIL